MKAYKDYMDNLSVDENLHEKLLNGVREHSSREAIRKETARKYIPVVAGAAALLIFFIAVYPLINLDKAPPRGNEMAPVTKGESSPFQDDVGIKVDKSYVEDDPVCKTIKQLSDKADYIFRGVFLGVEEVVGATSWQWQLFQVNHLYKGFREEREIRVVGRTDADALTLIAGAEYLVFAEANELPVYPWPLINPVYNQTIFEVMPEGGILVPKTVDRHMIPAVYSEEFQQNYDREISSSVVSVLHEPAYSVATSYPDLAEMLAHSDLVVRVTFSEIEYVNEYVSIGKAEQIQAEYKSDLGTVLPITIGINEALETGQEYLIFLRYDSEHEGLVLAARTGAIISPSNTKNWDEALALFK